MRTKKKLSITIDNKLLEEVEKTSKARNFSKSKLTEEALKLWFKKNKEELMAQGYREMAKEDQDFIELTLEAQKEALHE
jgi:metal-responsive CopG/Arc/MetJ family transcriptional regulator